MGKFSNSLAPLFKYPKATGLIVKSDDNFDKYQKKKNDQNKDKDNDDGGRRC